MDVVRAIQADLAHERNGYNQDLAGYRNTSYQRKHNPCTWCGRFVKKPGTIHVSCSAAKLRCVVAGSKINHK